MSDARRSASVVLRRWDAGEPPADDVQLVVSELVADAIEHGSGWVALRVTKARGNITVEVSGASNCPARMRDPEPGDPNGRGLVIVVALAQKWGVGGNGRTTWAHFPFRGIRDDRG
ncbi:ATP-binding protein [Streptomyces nigra]|uniref:ATP-binding protein n=1 Tax=Streptomyces nigra TaxID=1827580 RepID=UPI0036CCA1E5